MSKGIIGAIIAAIFAIPAVIQGAIIAYFEGIAIDTTLEGTKQAFQQSGLDVAASATQTVQTGLVIKDVVQFGFDVWKLLGAFSIVGAVSLLIGIFLWLKSR